MTAVPLPHLQESFLFRQLEEHPHVQNSKTERNGKDCPGTESTKTKEASGNSEERGKKTHSERRERVEGP